MRMNIFLDLLHSAPVKLAHRKGKSGKMTPLTGVLLSLLTALQIAGCSSDKAGGRLTNLGPMLLNKTVLGGVFGPGLNGEQWGYCVTTGEVGAFNVFNALSGKKIASYLLPEAGGSWGMAVDPDGRVYIGTWPNAKLFRFTPWSDGIEDLGQPHGFEGEPFAIWRIVTDPEGKVYGGVSGSTPNDGRVFKYNPETSLFTDYGVALEGNGTVRSIALSGDRLFAGSGPARCGLTEINLLTGAKKEISLPRSAQAGQYVYDAQVIGNRLLIRTEPLKKLLVYDLPRSKWVDEQTHVAGLDFAPSDGTDTWIVKDLKLQHYHLRTFKTEDTGIAVETARGLDWISLNDKSFPGKSLISLTVKGDAWIYNPQSGKVKYFTPEIDPQPVTLRSIARGPDGNIYASSYLSGGLARFNPVKKEKEQFPYGVGQAGTIAAVGEKLILGIYPSAHLLSFDPSKPFNFGENPIDHFNLFNYSQDRIFAIEPAGEQIAVGTIPAAGSYDGSLTIFDPATQTKEVFPGIIPGEGVGALEYDEKGTLYGGAGNTLFSWDMKAAKMRWSTDPGLGNISAIQRNGNGHLWVLTGTSQIFEFDPLTQQVLRSTQLYPNQSWDDKVDALLRCSRLLVNPDDGLLYGTTLGNFFRFDPKTFTAKTLDKNAYLLAQDALGHFYFARGADLFLYEK